MIDPDHPLAELLRRDRRYHRDAYFFVFEALRYAQEQLGIGGMASPSPSDPDEERARHRPAAVRSDSPIRRRAVRHAGQERAQRMGRPHHGDFGEIVFNLIDIGQMKKTDTDRREDFENVFDFDDGLRDAFLPITSDS